MRFSALQPQKQSGVLPIDPPTPYSHYLGSDSVHRRILVIHGLDVSRETMQFMSTALADAGFEVYSIDLPGHGDSTAKFQTELAEQAVRNATAFLGADIVLGHSMAAGLLLDLAATEHFTTMVLLSPPPVSVSQIHADRVLVATGELDVPRIRSFASVAGDIGSPNVEEWILPWGGHSAPIFNPAYIRRVVDWLGGDSSKTRTGARMFWLAAMFVASVVLGAALLPGQSLKPVLLPIPSVLAQYVIACGASLAVLKFANPLGWVRLFATDYVIGFVFIAGLTLLVMVKVESRALSRRERAAKGRVRPGMSKSFTRLALTLALRAVALTGGEGLSRLKAILSAAFVILIPGYLVSAHVLHAGLSGGRWWRFTIIALISIPLFLSDELLIRRIHPQWKSDTIAILTRILLLAFLLTGVLTLNRQDAFLVLIAPLIALAWIALWFAAGVVHRHTGDPLAAALFAAIVQGWAFAAWFVTI
jgi:pimeloyl-ACP methyl ester carboxylesterase